MFKLYGSFELKYEQGYLLKIYLIMSYAAKNSRISLNFLHGFLFEGLKDFLIVHFYIEGFNIVLHDTTRE